MAKFVKFSHFLENNPTFLPDKAVIAAANSYCSTLTNNIKRHNFHTYSIEIPNEPKTDNFNMRFLNSKHF